MITAVAAYALTLPSV